MSGIFRAIDVSATGLSLQRKKMDVVAENIANAETTRTREGGPYRRKRVAVTEANESIAFKTAMTRAQAGLSRTNPVHMRGTTGFKSNEVEISRVNARETEDASSSYQLIHDPDHPDANADGYVKMPDIEIVNEMVDMLASSRAYEANTMAITTAKEMAKNALDL
jgi:flagellar basal-body rod protein FlgC